MIEKTNIGIDFGTTNCCIGRIDSQGMPTIIGLIPSLGALSGDNLVFGKEARRLLFTKSEQVYPIRDLKLLLGSSEIINSHKRMQPVELATALLKHIKSMILPDDSVGKAVIGTPVRMSKAHRTALREAGKLAGFEEVVMVYEPTAALIGALRGKQLSQPGLALIVDWGGGTLDVAVVRSVNGLYQELSVDGDIMELGGTMIDEELARKVLLKSSKAQHVINKLPGGFELLKEQMQIDKDDILNNDGEYEDETFSVVPPGMSEPIYLEASHVFDVMKLFAQRAKDSIVKAVLSAGLRPDDITHLLFAGGVSQSQVVQEAIFPAFPNAERLSTSNPQLLTGFGCTLLSGEEFRVELAADLAVRQSDGSLCVMIPRGHAFDMASYRCADFEVSDVYASEAVFDFGLCHFDGDRFSMLAADGSTFRSLKQLYVATGAAETPGGITVPDLIRVHAGVDETLTVMINAQSNRSSQLDEEMIKESITGIPMSIRLETKEADN